MTITQQIQPEERAGSNAADVLAPVALAHWRRTISETYAMVRSTSPDEQDMAWQQFRVVRDQLFASHQQTPLTAEQQTAFAGLDYYDYDPAWRLRGELDLVTTDETFQVDLLEGVLRYTRVADIRFTVRGQPAQLALYWIEGYGGGLFLPFRDLTCNDSTYCGGRYLYDTIKGADLGVYGHEIVLDFNYAYNPSCAYDSRWVCPLPPRDNELPFGVEAGEKRFLR